MNQAAADLVTIYQSHSRKASLEHALVLEAMRIQYELHVTADHCVIAVRQADEAKARQELEAYTRENRRWLMRSPVLPRHGSGWNGVLVFTVVLIAVAFVERRDLLGYDWLAAGRMQAGLVRQGEWWRTVTSLTLHLDSLHLVANIFFGTLFGLFAGQLLGSGLAWFSVTVAGALGNTLNAFMQPARHSAVGASTAIFAILGILSAYAWRHQRQPDHGRLRQVIPLVGGVVLLALTGVGGARTDFIAHLTGFFSGLLLGAVYGSLGPRLRFGAWTQWWLGSVTLGLLAFCWLRALQQQLASQVPGA